MALFKSKRERYLWVATALVIFCIYASLGLAATLAEYLYHQQLSALILLAGIMTAGAVILLTGLQLRPGGVDLGIFLGFLLVYGFIFFRMTLPERSHLIEYSVVAILFYEVLTERQTNGGRVPVPSLLAIMLATAVGALDEGIQLYLPKRHFDFNDILFNFLTAVLAVVSMVVLGWIRRRFSPEQPIN